MVKPQTGGHELQFLGTDYGGCTVPVNLINEEWICYSVGVGVDASSEPESTIISAGTIAKTTISID